MSVILFWARSCALFLCLLLSGCGGNSSSRNDSAEHIGSTEGVCHRTESGINWAALQTTRCEFLSDYGLFTGAPNNFANSLGIPYELSNELFTDHARKYRYIYLPEDNKKMGFEEQKALDFPVGTALMKILALPAFSTAEADEDIIEVRLMVRRHNGWIFIPYVWDETINDARLTNLGSTTPAYFTHQGQILEFDYESPTRQRCEQCHQKTHDKQLSFVPIGPKTRYLNRTVKIDGNTVNQLEHWQALGLIDLPSPASSLPSAPNWRDKNLNLHQRAKAYLDINCAYCHNDSGSAALSGLRLEYERSSLDYNHGICNSAHGWRGGGFDIWPGRGDKSSIPLRMELSGATDRMPPIGRAVADKEAVALIRQWIDAMPLQECASG